MYMIRIDNKHIFIYHLVIGRQLVYVNIQALCLKINLLIGGRKPEPTSGVLYFSLAVMNCGTAVLFVLIKR